MINNVVFDNVKQFIKSSMSDWPGNITSIIFLGRCNFRCPFCINKDIAYGDIPIEDVPFEEIDSLFKEEQYRKFVNHVSICGGEPTIYPKLLPMVEYLKRDLGLSIKLDTNGSRPEAISTLLKERYLSYISMDIKAPFDINSYAYSSGVMCPSIEDIKRSIELIINSGISYDIRVVNHPYLNIGGMGELCLQLNQLGVKKDNIKIIPYIDPWRI